MPTPSCSHSHGPSPADRRLTHGNRESFLEGLLKTEAGRAYVRDRLEHKGYIANAIRTHNYRNGFTELDVFTDGSVYLVNAADSEVFQNMAAFLASRKATSIEALGYD